MSPFNWILLWGPVWCLRSPLQEGGTYLAGGRGRLQHLNTSISLPPLSSHLLPLNLINLVKRQININQDKCPVSDDDCNTRDPGTVPGTRAELNKIISPDVRIFPHEELPSSSLSGNSCHNIDKRSFSWTVPLINIVLFYPLPDPTKFMFEMLNWQKVDSINISGITGKSF